MLVKAELETGEIGLVVSYNAAAGVGLCGWAGSEKSKGTDNVDMVVGYISCCCCVFDPCMDAVLYAAEVSIQPRPRCPV